ncbi:4'-phosphopantetheinyl transferase superfamily protein [bacterium]|nr:4'-phosphopantetheinyl transferase superfamily protein [bacterium]
MALVEIRKLNATNYLGIWKIEEPESFFHENLWLDQDELDFLNQIKNEGRRAQWLSSRLLIRKIINPKGQILMEWDDFGKPVIINYDFEVSISHCRDMVAVIVGDRKSGIDIEKKSEKIKRIAKKFVRDDEWSFVKEGLEIEYFLAIWAAKETLFKYKGGGGIDFKEHMQVLPFDMAPQGSFHMNYLKNANEKVELRFEWVDEHMLTYCV